jgi:U3 small nucleolar RNA-associated protein 3
MGKGRRRNTAKTGDKALYVQKSHQQQQHSRPKRASNVGGGNDNDDNHDDDDNVYDPVDRFHRRREQKQQEEEFLRLDGNDESHGSDDEGNNVEAVMDLGVGGSDDDDDGSSRSSQGAGSSSTSASGSQTSESDEEEDEGDEDDSLEERGEEVEDVRDWGRRKSAYYHGDTADLEIGQEQDDAFLEEEAAKEIQKARMRELSEEDFVLEEDNDDDIRDAERTGKSSSSLFARVPPAASTAVAPKGLSHKLSRREKGRLLDRQSPEFLPLVRHFADVTRELHGRTDVAARALLEGEAGAAEVRQGPSPLFRPIAFFLVCVWIAAASTR